MPRIQLSKWRILRLLCVNNPAWRIKSKDCILLAVVDDKLVEVNEIIISNKPYDMRIKDVENRRSS